LRDVLLIDNNAIQLRVRETVLRHAAFLSLVPARARALSFVWLLPAPVKVILTDHLMSGTSGLVFVRQARELCPTFPSW